LIGDDPVVDGGVVEEVAGNRSTEEIASFEYEVVKKRAGTIAEYENCEGESEPSPESEVTSHSVLAGVCTFILAHISGVPF
jgi:hypothetical protein